MSIKRVTKTLAAATAIALTTAATANAAALVTNITTKTESMGGDLANIMFGVAIIAFICAFGAFYIGSNQTKRVVMVAIGAFGIALASSFVEYFQTRGAAGGSGAPITLTAEAANVLPVATVAELQAYGFTFASVTK